MECLVYWYRMLNSFALMPLYYRWGADMVTLTWNQGYYHLCTTLNLPYSHWWTLTEERHLMQSYSFTGAAYIQWLVNEGKPRPKDWLKPLLLYITAQHLPLPNLALFTPFPTLLIPRAAMNNISACKFSFHNLLLENPIY